MVPDSHEMCKFCYNCKITYTKHIFCVVDNICNMISNLCVNFPAINKKVCGRRNQTIEPKSCIFCGLAHFTIINENNDLQ